VTSASNGAMAMAMNALKKYLKTHAMMIHKINYV
jgi:hypothetical protein